MRHAILGAGGVGGLIGIALATAGEAVTMVVRPGTLKDYPREVSLQNSQGTFTAPVEAAEAITKPYDVLWIAVKATQLEASLRSVAVKPEELGAVVPLLNGIDHVALLRARFGQDRVVPAAIRVETERVAPGKFLVGSMAVRLNVSAIGESRLGSTLEQLRKFGIKCQFDADEKKLLWSKLVVLAPLALTTTASGLTVGEVCRAAEWRPRLDGAAREACAASTAAGTPFDANEIIAIFDKVPPDTRSSMQKDVAAGNPPELDAIAGPIMRAAQEHGFGALVTRELVEMIRGKSTASNQS
ncbi:MAG: 2-dehydropantoate 2-reductase [Acidobacteriia bacterium]|nr:2-dehydropantoate 2-reductase [Terriglobia bacterium]